MAFVIDVSVPFRKFLTMFQGEQPFIHIMYDEIKGLVTTVMKRFLKADKVNGLTGKQLAVLDVKENEYQLEKHMIIVGANFSSNSAPMIKIVNVG